MSSVFINFVWKKCCFGTRCIPDANRDMLSICAKFSFGPYSTPRESKGIFSGIKYKTNILRLLPTQKIKIRTEIKWKHLTFLFNIRSSR